MHQEFNNSHLSHSEISELGNLPDEDDAVVDAIREEERKASLVIANRLGSLESVGWSSFFGIDAGKHVKKVGGGGREGGDWERASTYYVSRDGEVRVKSLPW